MSAPELVRLIGLSHLLQPPLTLFLSSHRGINLRSSFSSCPPLAAAVVANMSVAAVSLPTALGLLLASYPTLAFVPGPVRIVAGMLAAFWCWRLYRQLFVLRPLWPRATAATGWMSTFLSLIFTVQGPGLGLLLLLQ